MNSTHPDCLIACTSGTAGSDNTGTLGIYAVDFTVNGVSVVNGLANPTKAKKLFFMHVQDIMVQHFMLMEHVIINQLLWL